MSHFSSQKKELLEQYQKLTQNIETLESSDEYTKLKEYIEWLKKQQCYYTEQSDLLVHSIDLLKKSAASIESNLTRISLRIKILRSDIPEMDALSYRRMSEFNYYQANELRRRICLASSELSRLEVKHQYLDESFVEYNTLIEKLSQKLALINECKVSIEDNIKKNMVHFNFIEKSIASLKNNLLSVERKIQDYDRQTSRYDRLPKIRRHNAVRYKVSHEHFLVDKEEEKKQKQEQARKNYVDAEIQRMDREENELLKTIEEEKKRLAEHRKKLFEMRSNNIARRREFLESL